MIYKIVFISIASIFFLLSCQTKSENQKNILVEVKKLEFSRSSDSLAWQNLYNTSESNIRTEIVQSLGKTRNPKHAHFLKGLLKSETDEELLGHIIFSLGQLNKGVGENALIALDLNRYSPRIQKMILASLGRCGTIKSIDFLQSALENPDLYESVLTSAALLARRNVNTHPIYKTITDTAAYYPSPEAFFYYLSYYQRTKPMEMISRLSKADDNSKKIIFKSFYTKLSTYKGDLLSFFENDSVFVEQLLDELRTVLEGKQTWDIKYNSLHLLSIVGDSTYIPLLEVLTSHNNIHVQIASYRAYSRLFPDDALGFLMSGLQSSENWYRKGEIINEISKLSPKKAFPFINNNLDKGNTTFQAALLEALGNMNNRLADTQIRQFLNVPDALLQHTAFNILDQKRGLRVPEVDALLDAESTSTVYLALNWKLKRKIRTDVEKLVNLFQKFDTPAGFDVQLLIVETLDLFKPKIEQNVLNNISQSIKDRKIYSALKHYHNSLDTSLIKFRDVVPDYLNPDSILAQKYSSALIKTTKGDITIRFFSDLAPLTVMNFTRLASSGFYKNILFHRVVPDFVIQAGDPGGIGLGGPGYSIPSEDNERPFIRGSIGMATAGWDTGGSQFFICHSPQTHLTGGYTLFAEVMEGMSVADQITVGDKIIDIALLK
jgi:cyclophilin family peptidyl-prolyl cis-trans isomerase/HEAT repeat protein